jgi:hypothetical protein
MRLRLLRRRFAARGLGLWLFSSLLFCRYYSADGSATDIEAAGDLGLADAGTMELPDLASLFSNRHRPAEMLSLEPRFANAGADTFAEDFVFESREHRKQPGHGATRWRCQVQCLGE